jgi:hypothetical protein
LRHIPEDSNLPVYHNWVTEIGFLPPGETKAIIAGGNHRLKEMARTGQAGTESVLQSTMSSCFVFICTLMHNLKLTLSFLRMNHPVEFNHKLLLSTFRLVSFILQLI